MTNKIQHERTLVVIKPDGVQRGLIGEIIKRIERSGLKLVGLKMIVPSEDFVESHYTLEPEWLMNVGKKSIEGLKEKGLTPPSEDPLIAAHKVLDALKKIFIVRTCGGNGVARGACCENSAKNCWWNRTTFF